MMSAADYRAELDRFAEQGMLSVKQVVAYTGLSYPAARELLIKSGGIKIGGTWRIAKPELAKWLASNKR